MDVEDGVCTLIENGLDEACPLLEDSAGRVGRGFLVVDDVLPSYWHAESEAET